MQSPAAIQKGAETYLNAGMTPDKAEAALGHAARTASALFTDTGQVSRFDVNAEKKLGIAPAQFAQTHNSLLHYSRKLGDNDGALLQAAPEVFNTMADSGLKGHEAVHLLGAWNQHAMQRDPNITPQKATASLQQVLERLNDPKVLASLKNQGVAVDRLMPKGVLGGVDAAGKPVGGQQALDALFGLLASLNPRQQAMLLPGSDHRAERAAMGDVKGLKQSVQEGQAASKMDLVGAALAQIKEADFGKITASEIAAEKLSLSPLADLATGAHADVSQFATENPATTAAMVATGYGAWRLGKMQYANMAEQAAKRQAAQEALLQQPRPLPKYNGGAQLTNQAEIDAWDQAQREAQKKARWVRATKPLLKWGVPLASGLLAASEALNINNDPTLSDQQKKIAWSGLAGDVAGSTIGGWGGAAMGAALGTAILPGIGTAIGGLLGAISGAISGGWLGNKAGTAAGSGWFTDWPAGNGMPGNGNPLALQPQPPLALLQSVMESSMRFNLAADKLQQTSQQPIPVHVTVDVQNGNIVAAVNQANKLELRRN